MRECQKGELRFLFYRVVDLIKKGTFGNDLREVRAGADVVVGGKSILAKRSST